MGSRADPANSEPAISLGSLTGEGAGETTILEARLVPTQPASEGVSERSGAEEPGTGTAHVGDQETLPVDEQPADVSPEPPRRGSPYAEGL